MKKRFTYEFRGEFTIDVEIPDGADSDSEEIDDLLTNAANSVDMNYYGEITDIYEAEEN